MPYQTNIPNASQSPGLFPAQANDNFTRLKEIIQANHKFNDSSAVDDGYHQNIKMLPVATPSNDGTVGQAFVNTANAQNQLYFKDGLNNVWQITPTLALKAMVIFDSNGNILNGGNAKYNVTSVVPQGTGIYKVNFTNAMSSIYYNWALGLVCSSSSEAVTVTTRSSSSYGQFITTTDFQIAARDSGGSNNSTFQAITALFYGG